jgi:nitroreductase/NAD-dependent dihydropyrimidine dehydrogenase PreA subunit
MSVFTIEVDESLCTYCGTCARVCGRGNARVAPGTGDCGGCLRCYAVCPSKAITVCNDSMPEVPTGGSSIGFEELEGFLASRRSTRRFLPDEPSTETLDRLLDAARYTPSGGNRRAHELTVVPRGPTRDLLHAELKTIYTKRSALLNNPVLKTLLKPFVGPYIRAFLVDPEYGGRIADLLAKLRHGEDPIFYGAPTVILFHSRVLIPTPKEDCLLAAYALALAAHASSLGSCFVTLAQSAINSSHACKRILGLAPGDAVHAVLVLGYPAVRFLRPAPRPSLHVHKT